VANFSPTETRRHWETSEEKAEIAPGLFLALKID
jgi:hypothetical protein